MNIFVYKEQTRHCATVFTPHLLPFGPFSPSSPGGPLRPGRPRAPECPGKPFAPGSPGGPGGPGLPGRPATPDSGLLKLDASWVSCSVGAQQKDSEETIRPKNWREDAGCVAVDDHRGHF